MANQELIDYINRQRAFGASGENIKEALLKAGWDAQDVEQGIAATAPAPEVAEYVPTAPVFSNVQSQEIPATPVAQVAPQASPEVKQMEAVAPQATMTTNEAFVTKMDMPAVAQSENTPAASLQAPVFSAAAALGKTPVVNQGTTPLGIVHPPVSMVMPNINDMKASSVVAPMPASPISTMQSAQPEPMQTMSTAAPAAMPIEKKEHGSSLKIIFIILGLLLVVGGGAYAYWKYVKSAAVPAPVPAADVPVVNDVIVVPDNVSTGVSPDTATTSDNTMVPIVFPSSMPQQDTAASSSEATSTTEAASSTSDMGTTSAVTQ